MELWLLRIKRLILSFVFIVLGFKKSLLIQIVKHYWDFKCYLKNWSEIQSTWSGTEALGKGRSSQSQKRGFSRAHMTWGRLEDCFRISSWFLVSTTQRCIAVFLFASRGTQSFEWRWFSYFRFKSKSFSFQWIGIKTWVEPEVNRNLEIGYWVACLKEKFLSRFDSSAFVLSITMYTTFP